MKIINKTVLCTALGLAGALIVLAPAQAQVAGSTKTVSVSVVETSQLALGWSVKNSILGKSLYNDAGEKIGKVQDLIIAPDKNASYLIVSVGSYLGLDKHDVAIGLNQIFLQGGKFVLPGASKAALKEMPRFEYASGGTRRAQVMANAEQELADARQQLAELQKKAAVASGTAKDTLNAQALVIQKNIQAAENSLTELKNAAAAKWQPFEDKLGDALLRIKQSLHKATA